MRYTRPLFDMLLTTLTQYLKLLESAFLVSGPERFSQGVQRKRGSSPSCFSRFRCFQRREGVGDRGEKRPKRQGLEPGTLSRPISPGGCPAGRRAGNSPGGIFQHPHRGVADMKPATAPHGPFCLPLTG